MLRLILISVSAIVIMVGFAIPFFVDGVAGYLLATFFILIASILLWFVENKTTHHLDKDSPLNKILNSKDGPD